MHLGLCRNWRELLLAVATLAFGSSIGRVFLRPGRTPVNVDSAFFEHAGWYISQGAVPYVDIWDIKPPLTIELTAILATVSFGNMYVLHVLSVLITAIVGIGSVYFVGVIIYEITLNEYASIASGFTMLTLAGYHRLAASGIRPKYFAIFFGLLSILLQIREKSAYSGGAAAIAAGFIQHAIVFPVLVLGIIVINQNNDWQKLKQSLSGIFVVTVVAISPIFLLGAIDEMIVEVVLAPLMASEESGFLSILIRLERGFLFLGYASIPVILGVYGVLKVGISDFKRFWWVVAGGMVYAIQVFFIDFDSYPDLFFGLAFVALGLGLLVNSVNKRTREGIIIVVAIIVVISVGGLGGFGIVSSSLDEDQESNSSNEDQENTLLQSSVEYVQSIVGVDDGGGSNNSTSVSSDLPYGDSEMERIYWNKVRPDSCHYRLSGTEITWVKQTDRSFTAEKCGLLP